MSEMWVERHRPRTVADIKGQKAVVDQLKAYAEKQTFPHLLFAGPPGTGKTTCLLYTSPSPRDATLTRMPSSA